MGGLALAGSRELFYAGTLRGMTEKAGFAVKRMKFFDSFPVSDNMYLVMEKT